MPQDTATPARALPLLDPQGLEEDGHAPFVRRAARRLPGLLRQRPPIEAPAPRARRARARPRRRRPPLEALSRRAPPSKSGQRGPTDPMEAGLRATSLVGQLAVWAGVAHRVGDQSIPARRGCSDPSVMTSPQGLDPRATPPWRDALTCSFAIGPRVTHRVYRRNLSTAYHECRTQPYADGRAPQRDPAGLSRRARLRGVAAPYAAVGAPWRPPYSAKESAPRPGPAQHDGEVGGAGR